MTSSTRPPHIGLVAPVVTWLPSPTYAGVTTAPVTARRGGGLTEAVERGNGGTLEIAARNWVLHPLARPNRVLERYSAVARKQAA